VPLTKQHKLSLLSEVRVKSAVKSNELHFNDLFLPVVKLPLIP
jgi:hypothetical protein